MAEKMAATGGVGSDIGGQGCQRHRRFDAGVDDWSERKKTIVDEVCDEAVAKSVAAVMMMGWQICWRKVAATF